MKTSKLFTINCIRLFSLFLFPICSFAQTLSGLWKADDGGTYYLSEQGNQLWWGGFSDDAGLQNGLTFCNIFNGTINGQTIDGQWADVPRGTSMNFGNMSLKIVFDVSGNPISLQKASGSTIGFGASNWTKQSIILPQQENINSLFSQINKNTFSGVLGSSLHVQPLDEDLGLVKDAVVIYGVLSPNQEKSSNSLPLNNNFPRDQSPRDFNHFIALRNPNKHAQEVDILSVDLSQSDADIDFDITVDLNYLSDDFYVGMTDALAKEVANKLPQRLHPEMVMFAHHDEDAVALLPGWAEFNGNSVLINGIPLNGDCSITNDQTVDVIFVNESNTIPGIHKIMPQLGNSVRISGVLAKDNGHDSHLELHPVYSVDFINASADNDLSGVWGDNKGCTYYVHCVNSAIWVLITKPFRDNSFAAVFQGQKTNEDTIQGTWSSIPYGSANGGGNMSFILNQNKVNMQLTGNSPMAPANLRKLYDSQGQRDSIKPIYPKYNQCLAPHQFFEGDSAKFSAVLLPGFSQSNISYHWSVIGATPEQDNEKSSFTIYNLPKGQEVDVILTVNGSPTSKGFWPMKAPNSDAEGACEKAEAARPGIIDFEPIWNPIWDPHAQMPIRRNEAELTKIKFSAKNFLTLQTKMVKTIGVK